MAKKDNGMLLLLLGAGALFAFAGKASAKDEPRGTVTPGEPTRIKPAPDKPIPQKPSGDPFADVAKAAAAAADQSAKKKPAPMLDVDSPRMVPYQIIPPEKSPLYPSSPSSIPTGKAPIASVPATASQPSASPSGSSSSPRSLPAGYDPAAARRAAKSVAAHLKRAGRAGYDRRLLEQWQRSAGLMPDRIYGGGTRGALLHYGVTSMDAPQPFFAPTTTTKFIPPEQR